MTQVTWANSKGGSGTATGTTSWSVPSAALQPGINVITVTAKDAAGNAASDTVSVTLTDAVAPAVTIASPTAANTHTTTAASVGLGGTASDLFGVTEVRWANNRGGAGVANGTTEWTVPAVALQPGANVITLTARDAAGNSATDSITITSDGKAPSLAITAPTGTGSFVTSAESVSLGGTVSDDVAVTELTWANGRGGSGVASERRRSWTMAGLPLQPGVNVITVTARDGAGNKTSATISVTRDSRAPVIEIAAPAAGGTFVTNTAAVALRGTAADDAAITQVTWQNNRGGGGTAAGTSDWSVASASLQAGANVITVTARDAAGNTSSATTTVTLDTRAPVVAILTPATGATMATTDAAIVLGGSATDETSVAEVTWVNSQGGRGVATGTAAWSTARIALRPGLNTLTVTARDTAGNTATATLAVRATDVKAPAVRITAPSANESFSTAVGVINLEGTAPDDFGPVRTTWVSDRGASGVANGDQRWIVRVALQPGVNVITVTARDAAGNAASDVVRITYERGAPTIALTSPTTAATYASSSPNVALTGVASDESGVARVTWSTDKGQIGVATGTTSWSIPAVTLQFGVTTVVTVTAHDNSGNTTSVALAVTYTDAVVPAVKIYSPTTGASFTTAATSVTIGGTATDNVGVTEVSWSNSQGGSGVMFGTNSWTALGIPLAPGTNVLTVTARDAAGNTGVAVLTVTSTATSGQLRPIVHDHDGHATTQTASQGLEAPTASPTRRTRRRRRPSAGSGAAAVAPGVRNRRRQRTGDAERRTAAQPTVCASSRRRAHGSPRPPRQSWWPASHRTLRASRWFAGPPTRANPGCRGHVQVDDSHGLDQARHDPDYSVRIRAGRRHGQRRAHGGPARPAPEAQPCVSNG